MQKGWGASRGHQITHTMQQEETLTFGRQVEELVDFMRLQFDLWDDVLLLHLQGKAEHIGRGRG